MERLTESIEVQIEEKLRMVDAMVQKTSHAAESLLPHTESLKVQLERLDGLIGQEITKKAKESFS